MPSLSFSPQKSRGQSTSLGPIPSGGSISTSLAGPAYSPYGIGKGLGLGAPAGSLATTSTSTSTSAGFPPPVPPKMMNLNSSTRSTDRESGKKITRRAFLCDVVVEREGEGEWEGSVLVRSGRLGGQDGAFNGEQETARSMSREMTSSRERAGWFSSDVRELRIRALAEQRGR
jgi:hypothetical protein